VVPDEVPVVATVDNYNEPDDPFDENVPDADPENEPDDPFDENVPEADPEAEPYDPFKEYEPNEDPEDKTPEEISNPSKSGTITVSVPEQPEQTPAQIPENEPEQDPEEKPKEEDELELVTPEGEPERPAETPETIEIRVDLEKWGYEPEYEPEEEIEQSSEIELEYQPEQDPLKESEPEAINQPEQESQKELVPINPETGEPVPPEIDWEFIPLQDYLEKLYEQQQNIDEVPDTETKQESEVISEQQQGKIQKKKHINAKKLELITDPKELGKYKHYEYQHIIKTKYDPIFSQKQIKKPQKNPAKKQKSVPKKKPTKVKKLEPITDPKELGEYKYYEYSHTIKTKYSQRQAQKKPEKSEKNPSDLQKQVQKKKPIKVKKLESITDPKELGEYKHYEYSHTIKANSTQKQGQKKSENSEKKSEISQKTKKESKPEEVKELELIVDGIETEKSEESHESNTEPASEQPQRVAKNTSEKQEVQKSSEISKEKVNKITEQESQTQRKTLQNVKVKKQKKVKREQKIEPVSTEILELRNKYRKETGKRPIYNKKDTKGFKEWLEKRKKLVLKKSKSAKKSESRGEWEILLEKWINEFDEKELSQEIKEELTNIVRKYRKFRAIYRKIIQLVQKENLTKKETDEIEGLLKNLEKMTEIQAGLFKNLRTFEAFYNQNVIWFKYHITAQRERFINHLAQKLKNLKKIERSDISFKKNWKEILKENLHKSTELSMKEKSKIIKILQKRELTEQDNSELKPLLSKLSRKELISLLGREFESFNINQELPSEKIELENENPIFVYGKSFKFPKDLRLKICEYIYSIIQNQDLNNKNYNEKNDSEIGNVLKKVLNALKGSEIYKRFPIYKEGFDKFLENYVRDLIIIVNEFKERGRTSDPKPINISQLANQILSEGYNLNNKRSQLRANLRSIFLHLKQKIANFNLEKLNKSNLERDEEGKVCSRCGSKKSYKDFFKRENELIKHVCKSCHTEITEISKFKKKYRLLQEIKNGIYGGSCANPDCKINFKWLPAMEFHHLGKKTAAWKDLYKKTYEKIKQILDEKDRTEPLCSNCHTLAT